MNRLKKIGCVFDHESSFAEDAFNELSKRYNIIDIKDQPDTSYDVVITLGGDGMMLRALHMLMGTDTPIYGMNRGSVGFLLNEYKNNSIEKIFTDTQETILHPLEMKVTTINNKQKTALAVNEVSLLRETSQSANIKISVNNKVRLEKLIADGVLVCTPAGSTAYNYAAYGPILPLTANILALTAISPFRPRRWQGALLPRKSIVKFEVQEISKRPVSAVADSEEIRDVKNVEVYERPDIKMRILFDKSNKFEERVLKEQFMP